MQIFEIYFESSGIFKYLEECKGGDFHILEVVRVPSPRFLLQNGALRRVVVLENRIGVPGRRVHGNVILDFPRLPGHYRR